MKKFVSIFALCLFFGMPQSWAECKLIECSSSVKLNACGTSDSSVACAVQYYISDGDGGGDIGDGSGGSSGGDGSGGDGSGGDGSGDGSGGDGGGDGSGGDGGGGCSTTPDCYCRDSNKLFMYSYGCVCPDGQYGYSGAGFCSNCPNGGASWAGDNMSITSCYLPPDTVFSDNKGQFIYTSNCYYEN